MDCVHLRECTFITDMQDLIEYLTQHGTHRGGKKTTVHSQAERVAKAVMSSTGGPGLCSTRTQVVELECFVV